jgi:PncC family amidohydrolase
MQNSLFTIAKELGQALRTKELTIATAESCTGGLLGHLLTSVSGSSEYYIGGIIAYSNAVKEAFLGVRHKTLVSYGAVSEQTAKEMAAGVRERIGSDIGISTTGIAGPTGGTPEKPVGLVYIGISTRKETIAIECHFDGSREEIKEQTARTLLGKTVENINASDSIWSITAISDKKKILILMSDAGMGHRSASDALKDAILLKYGDSCDVEINNPLDHPKTPKALWKSQTDYDEIIKKLPELYKVGYEISDGTLPTAFINSALIAALYAPLRDIIFDYRPDLVLITYPMYQAPLDAVLTLNNLPRTPLVTVVTDLVTVHKIWFEPNMTRCAVPTDEVRQLALKSGLREDQIIETGIPVNPKISALQQTDQKVLRRELGWDEDLTPILVVGSPRMFNLAELLPTLDQSESAFQLILVAGGNDELRDQLQEISWKHPTHLYDFVEDLPKLMRAADIMICKAGGLIVTESLASGLPLIIVDALPGQEVGNAEFVVANQAGEFCRTSEDLQDCVNRWLANDGKVLHQMTENAARTGKPEAAFAIANESWKLIQEGPIENSLKNRLAHIVNLQELLSRFNVNLNG